MPPVAAMTAKVNRNEKRRTNKPLMEKRRRARINHSLAVLKSLIIKDEQSEASTSQSRLEKADILELTVLHLRSLEKQQKTDEPDRHLKSYQLGYQACSQDIERFLNDTGSGSGSSKERLIQHLALQQEKLLRDLPVGSSSSSDIGVKPTRLPDGRLALIISPPSSWLSIQADPAPATPPSSPAQQQVSGGVWRPWF